MADTRICFKFWLISGYRVSIHRFQVQGVFILNWRVLQENYDEVILYAVLSKRFLLLCDDKIFMRTDVIVEHWLEDEVEAVELVPDKRKTSGTQGFFNMDGVFGFEYTWRLNAYPQDDPNSDSVYREHIQSGSNEYLNARRTSKDGEFEFRRPEEDEKYQNEARERAEELAEEFEEKGLTAEIDYDSFEEPEVNVMWKTPESRGN